MQVPCGLAATPTRNTATMLIQGLASHLALCRAGKTTARASAASLAVGSLASVDGLMLDVPSNTLKDNYNAAVDLSSLFGGYRQIGRLVELRVDIPSVEASMQHSQHHPTHAMFVFATDSRASTSSTRGTDNQTSRTDATSD